jgi:hypothetical protein
VTTTSSTTPCPRCGEPATGKFCAACGATLGAQDCQGCGKPLSPGARFCHHCGATASGGAAPAAPAPAGKGMTQAWTIAAAVVVVLIAFVAGQQLTGKGAAEPAAPMAGNTAPFAGGGRASTDINNMSPEEAASRLFDRVMRYASEGKADSAAMFAPMAILAYERIGPLDLHARYDIGAISVVTGDAVAAAAQADTILKAQPNHLLGLILAARAADAKKDAASAKRFRDRLTASATAERANGLREYTDHKQEIDDALGKTGGKKAP